MASSPLSSADTPRRTFGRFIPDAETASASAEPSPSNLESRRRTGDRDSLRQGGYDDLPKFSHSISEHEKLVDEILGLEKREQIELLLAEIDVVKLQVDMQGKALDGFIKKNARDKDSAGARLHDLESRSTDASCPNWRHAAAIVDDAVGTDHEILEDLARRIEKIEEDAHDRFMRGMVGRACSGTMRDRMEAIGAEIEEMRMGMRHGA